jgi:hypothetical protein
MPLEAPGKRYEATATKATTHGAPATELNHPGIAAKSAQIAPMVPSVANAAIAQQIAINEGFIIMLAGKHEVASGLLPGGTVAGSQLFIRASDNALVLAATALTGGVLNAGFQKFGVVDSIDTTRARALVNLDLRSTF